MMEWHQEASPRRVADLLENRGFRESEDFVVIDVDVRRVKSISAAAAEINRIHPEGFDVLVNNAAVAPDGFGFEVRKTEGGGLFVLCAYMYVCIHVHMCSTALLFCSWRLFF